MNADAKTIEAVKDEKAESWPRDVETQIEKARRTAAAIIAKRATIPDIEGLDFSECLAKLVPEGGEFTSTNEWAAENLEKLSDDDRAERLSLWEKHERLLPVYYEYARQSPKLLHLAVMHVTSSAELPEEERYPHLEAGKPSARGGLTHPLDLPLRKGIDELHSRIGGFAEAVIRSLGGHLVNDRPYPLIPLRERKWAVSFAISCNDLHRIGGPWLTDAGPVSDPWVAPLVGHDDVRLAYTGEATTTANIRNQVIYAKEVLGQPFADEHLVRFDGALNATTNDGTEIDIDGKKVWKRVIDDDGGEIIAFRLNWRDTRDSELKDMFHRLIKQLRPKEKWPERDEANGVKARKEPQAALDALIKLRARRASEIPWRDLLESETRLEKEFREHERAGWPNAKMRADAELKLREIEGSKLNAWNKYQDSEVTGGKRAIATKCFQKINGEDETPWWAERFANSS